MPIIQTDKPLRKRDKNDLYPTPHELIKASLNLLPNDFDPRLILDPGCYNGEWGWWANLTYPESMVIGVDIQFPEYRRGENLDESRIVYLKSDYLTEGFDLSYDLILGNPPYKYAEEFVRKSYSLLSDNGILMFLLRLAFLEGQKRTENLWQEMPPTEVHVLNRRPSFTGDRKTDATAYAVYLWKKGQKGTTTLNWLLWDYED